MSISSVVDGKRVVTGLGDYPLWGVRGGKLVALEMGHDFEIKGEKPLEEVIREFMLEMNFEERGEMDFISRKKVARDQLTIKISFEGASVVGLISWEECTWLKSDFISQKASTAMLLEGIAGELDDFFFKTREEL